MVAYLAETINVSIIFFPVFQNVYRAKLVSSWPNIEYFPFLAEPMSKNGAVFLLDINSVVKQIPNGYNKKTKTNFELETVFCFAEDDTECIIDK